MRTAGRNGSDAAAPATAEAELVERARGGDASALTALLDRHEPQLRGLLGSMLGVRADLDDLLQETRLRAVRAIAGFRGSCTFASWASRIALNLAVSALRKRRAIEAMPLDLAASDEDPTRLAERAELRERLAAAADRLPPAMREAFDLRYREALDPSVIARRLGVPAATIRTRLFHARRRLREALDDLVSE